MLEIASQMILCLLLAALLGAIIGYILGKSTCGGDDCQETSINENDASHDAHGIATTSAAATSTVAAAATTIASDSTQKPEILTAPRNGVKDNLTRIKGVGLKIESMLNDIGIYHFDQIASWNKENITWADSTLGFPGRAEREHWVSQAQALASGEETEFSKRVDAGKVSSSKQS